jgi:uncharacterized protein
MAHLAHLMIYPIKSLDSVAVERATVLASGALQHDREFAIVDQAGKFVNGKRTTKVHGVRSSFDLKARMMTLRVEGGRTQAMFHLDDDRPDIAAWLSDYFEMPVQLIQNTEVGFPDDLVSPGPTVVSTATLAAIASWFPELSLSEVRSRFRANLEIGDVPAFWEDQLFSETEVEVPFTVGAVKFLGVNPCQRCVVISRDSQTGEVYPQFQKQFIRQRKATLPDWTAPSRFNHFYRLAVNTRMDSSQAGKTLQIGDSVDAG